MFDDIEMFYKPTRKHARNGMLSPVEFERQHKAQWTASGLVDNSQPHAAAVSNASGLTPPRWL